MDFRRNDGSEVQVHDRVVSEGHYGTVRFIGTLPDTKGKQILTPGSSMVSGLACRVYELFVVG